MSVIMFITISGLLLLRARTCELKERQVPHCAHIISCCIFLCRYSNLTITKHQSYYAY